MNLGWIKLHRKLKDHWIWTSDNRLKWWIDILLTVNHAENKVLLKGTLVNCGRGQSVKSLQEWAKDWNVSKKTVSDFFKLLKKDNMLLIENLKITTRITVLNYDSYNDSVNATETASKRKVNATETTSKREHSTNKNDKNKENEKNDKEQINRFEVFWNSYHLICDLPKTDKEAAEKYFKKLDVAEQQKSIDNIKKYFLSLSDPKFCKKARTYLSDKNFNDEFKAKPKFNPQANPRTGMVY